MRPCSGGARERLIDPAAVPDDLLGDALVLLYKELPPKRIST
jgi:hypothetical protein